MMERLERRFRGKTSGVRAQTPRTAEAKNEFHAILFRCRAQEAGQAICYAIVVVRSRTRTSTLTNPTDRAVRAPAHAVLGTNQGSDWWVAWPEREESSTTANAD